MDCSIVPSRHSQLSVISTTDFFYPLVDDPYIQGRIACCNVLSDMYAMAVVDIDNVLMLLAASTAMEKDSSRLSTRLLIRGFNDAAEEAGTLVTGGQSVLNPWPIIGGVAMSTCTEAEFIRPENAVVGDVLVLTKPLGTQPAVNVYEWLQKEQSWKQVEGVITREEGFEAYRKAIDSMARLNRNGARLMHKYGAHAGTDVTGFGILGHANNLAKAQRAAVHLEIHTLPVIKDMVKVDRAVTFFNLVRGFSAETSGGLLVSLPASAAESFVNELKELDDRDAWIIGSVKASSSSSNKENRASIVENVKIVEV